VSGTATDRARRSAGQLALLAIGGGA